MPGERARFRFLAEKCIHHRATKSTGSRLMGSFAEETGAAEKYLPCGARVLNFPQEWSVFAHCILPMDKNGKTLCGLCASVVNKTCHKI